ncbi:MAG: hypothetical protein ONB44_21535 [candidate division KSB1 bacterium]|nr:hypothetical protein [candidate division KSB1 bacterium]MDZ7304719.1 hypothetical protein [candidate division KSB1 bacterium]MDZ7312775.1 hypothetical protein [candidate division KSB1 bacterium]
MRIIHKITLPAVLFVLTILPLAAQTSEREKLKAELDSLSTNLARLHQQQQTLSLQADSLAKDIQRRKQRAPSLLQDRGLTAALRFSQTLADSMQNLQEQQQRLDRLLRQKAEHLLKILNDDIARLVRLGENLKRQKNSVQREQVARELLQCREWQRRCQEWLEQPPPAIIIYQVEVHPEDSPETLRRKADFVRDQADRLYGEVKRLEAKIAEIRAETQIRERVADLATDLALLDPNREGVSTASHATGNQETKTSFENNPQRGAFDNLTTTALQFSAQQLWPTQLGELTFDDLERWQGRLEQQKKRRRAQADSLVQRAETIEQLIATPAGEKRR